MISTKRIAIACTGALAAALLFTPLAGAQDRQAEPSRTLFSEIVRPTASGDEGGLAGGAPDVIVSSMAAAIVNTTYSAVGDISPYSMTSVSCNIGTAPAIWIDISDPNSPQWDLRNQHPVIGQNMYRLQGGRFEQIGMSWLKHGFCAADQPSCGSPYQGIASCDWLGLFATDTYSSTRNGTQSFLGPRSEVNPWTGVYPYPYIKGWNLSGNGIYKRLQVRTSDLDPGLNEGALYFGEVQYICTDEPPENRYNNVSYRRIVVGTFNGSTQKWNLSATGGTIVTEPAINAWRTNDPQVVLTNIDVPNDGRLILGSRVTDLGGGNWNYEYALYNMNADRAVQAFGVPMASGMAINDMGFHDVDYHSGEDYSSVDWTQSVDAAYATWATLTHAQNINANALRWGTTYNFRFTSPNPPKYRMLRVDYFKPGDVAGTTVRALGPTNCPADIAPNNGVGDGNVNVSDLLAVIAAWGPCPMPTDCPADIAPLGGDDVVNVSDLLAVIGAWGSCP